MKLRSRVENAFVAARQPASALRLGLLRYAFVARNRSDARRYAENALYQTRIAAALRNRREHVHDSYYIDELPFEGEPTVDELLDRLIIGDVETCIERAAREIRDAKVSDLVIQAKLGDLPHRLAMGSLQLWMEEVVPGIARELGQPIESINRVPPGTGRAAASSGSTASTSPRTAGTRRTWTRARRTPTTRRTRSWHT